MVNRMKTTVEIPDALARDAKQLARKDGVTLRELVVAGLRTEVERRRSKAERPDFHFPTVAGQGLATGLDPTDVVGRSYGLPT